jgi:hypothetical protein
MYYTFAKLADQSLSGTNKLIHIYIGYEGFSSTIQLRSFLLAEPNHHRKKLIIELNVDIISLSLYLSINLSTYLAIYLSISLSLSRGSLGEKSKSKKSGEDGST